MKPSLSTVVLIFSLAVGSAAAADPIQSLGVEVQRYPVGTIASLVYRHPIDAKADLWFGVGFNDADREDNGKFDDEQAQGPGVSVGYRRYLKPTRNGWSWGGRLDLWDLEVDWVDQAGTPASTRGTTDTRVLQPTVVAAHAWKVGNRAWVLELSLALGAEINVRTDGPDVGEGAIVLGGVSLLRRH